MWTSDEMGFIHDLVFDRKLAATQGKILEHMTVHSHQKLKDWPGRVCELSAESMAAELKIPLANFRHHLRVMETNGVIKQVYVFPESTFVFGYKKALATGIRACVSSFYSLDIIDQFNFDRAKK